MKNIKKMVIWMDLLLYIMFSYIYSSDGLEIQLATKSTELHKVYVNNECYYDYYYYNSISPLLCKIGLIGMIVTGILFLLIGTYKTYKKFEINKSIKWKNIRNLIMIITIVVLYILFLHIIRRFIYINFCMLVGE